MRDDILRWATDINAAYGQIPNGLAGPTWPAARGGSDPELFAQAENFASVTRPTAARPASFRGSRGSGPTNIALQIIITNVRLDAHQVTQHPRHYVFPEDNNLLIEEPYPTRVRRQV